MKRALILGLTGQDGSYLAELLLEKGYDVHGVIRRASTFNTTRVDHVFDRLHVHHGDLTDGQRLAGLLARIRPREVYNLAAQSHVGVSFENPVYTANVVALGTMRLLEAIRQAYPDYAYPRVYQASSSEMFGNAPPPQNERTPFNPRSPYACAKACAHFFAVNYREAYGMPVSCGILFNHESERRGETFVTRKIIRAIGRIKASTQTKLFLGNLDARRDWGYAPDYVRAMWMMMQADPGDYVVATGESHSVREFVQVAFGYAELDWHKYVETDPKYERPTEVHDLMGDSTKAREELGWKPSVTFEELVRRMVDADVALAAREAK